MTRKKLRFVFVTGWYSEKFGYIHNCLPKVLSDGGYDVHVVTSNTQQFFNDPKYQETYAEFLGDGIVAVGTYQYENFTIHRLPYTTFKTEVLMKGVYKKLKSLKPDVVHIFDCNSRLTFKLAVYKYALGYKLITSNHIHSSVFAVGKAWPNYSIWKKMKWKLLHFYTGRFIQMTSVMSTFIAEDTHQVAKKYFGCTNDKKSFVIPLGTDISRFKPVSAEQKNAIRGKWQFELNDFVLIYTGRFSDGKNPLVLAEAVAEIGRENPSVKALFVGSGVQEKEIMRHANCRVVPFVQNSELPGLYALADMGVWPAEESMSMLDCMATGIPVILHNQISVTDRIVDQKLVFEKDNVADLVRVIRHCLNDRKLVHELSAVSRNRAVELWSWERYAEKYLETLGNRAEKLKEGIY